MVASPEPAETREPRRYPPLKFARPHFKLDCILDAFDTFARAASTQALNVITNAN